MIVPISILPYVSYARRQLFGDIPLSAAAFRQEVLCAAETIRIRNAVFVPEQVDRITATDPGASLQAEILSATSEIIRTVPTIAYHIRDAVLVDGSIYKGQFKSFVAARSLFKSSPRVEPYHIETIGLASSHLGSRYFGHWLVDDCLQYELATEHGQPLCLRGPVYPEHQKKYQSYFGQVWTPIDRARIDQLIVYQDYHWGTAHDSLRAKLFRSLRKRARAHLPVTAPATLIYLKRGSAGVKRKILDEDRLLEDLEKSGFTIIDFETESLDELLSKLSSAKIVVSLEGSHASHCTFSIPENSGLIILQPADRFLSFHRGWTTAAGVWFGFVVGLPSENGYKFAASEILQCVEMMTRRMAKEPIVATEHD